MKKYKNITSWTNAMEKDKALFDKLVYNNTRLLSGINENKIIENIKKFIATNICHHYAHMPYIESDLSKPCAYCIHEQKILNNIK